MAMNRSKLVDEVGERLRQVLEASPAKDLERNVRAVLSSVFSRLDLVTREEFDVQREVLLRTRERMNELERKLAEIERRSTAS
jgi:BMFP domain-containing protein YqiC